MEVEMTGKIEARGRLWTTGRIQGGFRVTLEGLCQLRHMVWLRASLLG